MGKRSAQKTFDLGAVVYELREVSLRIRGLAYLIGNHSVEDAIPLDLDDLSYGIGQILDSLGQEVCTIAVQIDEAEVETRKS